MCSPWTPQRRSRRVQSASRALPDALGDVFWSSLGVPSSALGCPWAVLERSGPSWAQSSGGLPSSTFASRPPQFHPHSFKHHPQSSNHSKPSPGLQRPVEAARGGPAAGGVALKIRRAAPSQREAALRRMRSKDPKGARDFSHRWEVRGSSERTPLPKGPTFRHHRSHPHFYSTFGQNGAGTRTRQLRQRHVGATPTAAGAPREGDSKSESFSRGVPRAPRCAPEAILDDF